MDAYISNFSLLLSLELLERFVVVGCPSLRVRVKLGGKGGQGRGGGCQFLSLREAYIPNLSLLRSLEPLEKFVVAGGGWVVLYFALHWYHRVEWRDFFNAELALWTLDA